MNHLAREPKKRARKATIMVPQQTSSGASSPNNTTGNAAVVKFGSLLVDRKSSTPYSDATQVSIDFLLKTHVLCAQPFLIDFSTVPSLLPLSLSLSFILFSLPLFSSPLLSFSVHVLTSSKLMKSAFHVRLWIARISIQVRLLARSFSCQFRGFSFEKNVVTSSLSTLVFFAAKSSFAQRISA